MIKMETIQIHRTGGTVGSLAIGYDDLPNASPESKGYAKLYIPSYEKDKVLVFSMGKGQRLSYVI